MNSSKQFVCDECGESFTKNKNRLRHAREKHQGMKRSDKKRKIDQENTDRKQGLLACRSSAACEDSVGSITQVASKSSAEYVTMAMEAHEDKQLTSEEFMKATGLSVFKLITDTFWTLLYKRPDLYVYVTEEMLSWLGFQAESHNQKKDMLQTLNARSISQYVSHHW